MIDLKIDPEFQNKIPPLTEAEFEQLRENILAAGEVYEPIVTWNGVIVDGNNRYKIIRDNPGVKWRAREMQFADRWAAFEWMYKNQLGRRNLTDEQRTYMIGKMYEARKKSVGAPEGNANAKKQMLQNANIVFSGEKSKSQNSNLKSGGRTPRTDEIIGEELGVNHATVHRAYKFAQGVDALKEVNPEAADKVLRGEANVTKAGVRTIKDMDGEAKARVAKAIEQGEQVKFKTEGPPKAEILEEKKKNAGRSTERRERMKIIERANQGITDDSVREKFNADDLLEEIRINGSNYAAQLRRSIEMRSEILNEDGAREKARNAVDEIVNAIMDVRKSI